MSDEEEIPRRRFFLQAFRQAAKAATDGLSQASKQVREFGKQMSEQTGGRSQQAAGAYSCWPPGAVAEADFRRLCTQCGDCIRACPAQAIRPGSGLYPRLWPNNTACALCDDPLPCVQSCETGALMPIPRESVRLGLARVFPARCLTIQGTEDCRTCLTYCPLPGEALRMTEEGPKVIEAGCTGCGLCAVTCPTEAIRVLSL